MVNVMCLDESYSTTKRLTKEKPHIENKPEDKLENILFLSEDEKRVGEGGLRTKGYFKKSYNNQPLVSIITVVYNGEKHLEKTIESILTQTYDNVEYIIIDGGSNDGTLDIIKKYEDQIDYWVSEKDNGIYDAMNKGLTLSIGEIIGILNADDVYTSEAVRISVNALIEQNVDYSVGTILKVPSNIFFHPIFPLETGKIYQGMMYPHIASFIRRNIYKNVGLFNTSYKIAADMDMALRIHLSGFCSTNVNKLIALFSDGGISSVSSAKKENLAIAISYGKPRLSAYYEYVIQLLKFYIAKVLPNRLVNKIRARNK